MKTIQLAAALITLSATTAFADCLARAIRSATGLSR